MSVLIIITKTIWKIIKIIILLIIIFFLTNFYIQMYYPCITPLPYSIGSIDKKFQITQSEAKKLIQEAEYIWEKPAKTNLFRYDKNSDLKINFIYDQRQQNLKDAQTEKDKLDILKQPLTKANLQYTKLYDEYNKQVVNFNTQIEQYKTTKTKYESEVKFWNQNNKISQETYNKLQAKRTILDQQYNLLKKQELTLKNKALELTKLAEQNNLVLKRYNQKVTEFNKQFGVTKEFDQGNYTGRNINLYYFENFDDLKLLIAHELGHSLGINHVQNTKSLMYYLMKDQDSKNFHITQQDNEVLNSVCHMGKNYEIIKKTYNNLNPFLNETRILIDNLKIKIQNFKSGF